MFIVPTALPRHSFNESSREPQPAQPNNASQHRALPGPAAAAGRLSALLSLASMERSAPEYSQSGLPSPYPSNFGDTQSEGSSADHASGAQYPVKQEVNYSTSATPTSDYSVYPPSARSGTFPDHLTRPYHPAASSHSSSSGGMAQQPNSPSMPQQDGRSHNKSDSDVPIDPSIAAPSPTYPYPQSPYPPGPQHVPHSYQQDSAGLYQRPDWGQYNQPPLTPGAVGHGVFSPGAASGQRPSHQVYSFVPIPGAQQHKRPRRRYEEIERMYKCGWHGCEKAYGTLNHLNAHVTMQSHGQKRTPEEFKEIRKEWKQRKKEEEARNKEREQQHRQQAEAAAQAAAQNGEGQPGEDSQAPPGPYSVGRPVLPPIGYQSSQYPAPPSAGVPQQSLPEYNTSPMYPNYPPQTSPYSQYGQSANGGQPPNQ